MESTLTKDSLDKLSLGEWDSLLMKKPMIRPKDKTSKLSYQYVNCYFNLVDIFLDYFNLLSDEVVLHIFSWLGKRHLVNTAGVCRRFNRLIRDESLWTRMDLSCKYLEPGALGKFLSRQVVVLRLARSEVRGYKMK